MIFFKRINLICGQNHTFDLTFRSTGFNKYFSNNFSQAEDWQPLVIYRNSLVHGEGEVPTVTSKRPYGRKRRYDDDESEEEDDLNDPNYR